MPQEADQRRIRDSQELRTQASRMARLNQIKASPTQREDKIETARETDRAQNNGTQAARKSAPGGSSENAGRGANNN